MSKPTYSKGLEGVIAGETAIATVGKKGHGLMYRGKCFFLNEKKNTRKTKRENKQTNNTRLKNKNKKDMRWKI